MEQNDKSNLLKINKINNEIKNLNKEKSKIQSECLHKENALGFNEKKSIVVFCKSCYKELRFANTDEIDDFLKK